MSPEILLRVRDGVVYLIALILSICVHEFGHAFVADKLGDPLPRAQGRVTLNPIPHIDPVGTLLLPGLAIAFPGMAGFMLGWGKPVRVSLSARSMTKRFSLKTLHLFIAAAGPMMNLLFALLLSGVYLAMLKFAGASQLHLTVYVATVVAMNIGLAFFNLIPCPPLDGGAILRGILPRSLDYVSDFLERYGFMIFLALFMTGILYKLMWPAEAAADWWVATITRWVVQ